LNLQEFVKTYQEDTGFCSKALGWERLPADGSKRVFYRVGNEEGSCIVMANPPAEPHTTKENRSYIKIGKHLLSKGIPVPRMYRYDLDHGWFIMEDLGRHNLQDIAIDSDSRIDLYRKVIKLLIKIQLEGREGFDTGWCYHTKSYDRYVMERFESDYFLTYFLKGLMGLTQDLSPLQGAFQHLSSCASLAENNFLLHRDFQSRNLIINGHAIGVVDWQGARLGPLQYDLASLLIDPYVGMTDREKTVLFDYYITLLDVRLPGMSGSFTRYYPYLAIQRNLQILGAFSYLSKIQGKKQFLTYISPSITSLEELLEGLDEPQLSPLRKLVGKLEKKKIPRGTQSV